MRPCDLRQRVLQSGARSLVDSVELGDALVLRAHVHALAKEYDAARCLYEEALVLRKRMNTWIDIFWVRTAMAQLALDQDSADEAKLHLDDALALMPVVDFQQNGLFLIALTAEWAALVGQYEVAVFLDAACKEQHARAGAADT